jgi:hypothetical protein
MMRPEHVSGTEAAATVVTYESPCECLDNHGKQRWAEKPFLRKIVFGVYWPDS